MHNFVSTHQTLLTIAAVVVILLLVAMLTAWSRRPRELHAERFQRRWQEIQKLCAKGDTWPVAIIDADKLLDEALKGLRLKGKTMGERLVEAQRRLSDNDGVWFGHKLRNKIAHEDTPKLERKDVEAALRGFRQALKDLGAL
ncbi:MAG TPA: hypothetical protein VHC98_00140 [Candidatus Saccharimonadales bacterium]|nr:hypothetical protein [Candidatus Saccharimonadales bacterium]